jgi:ABC-type sugar transport system ATPase subunit
LNAARSASAKTSADAASPAGGRAPLLSLDGIAKSYPPNVQALRSVSLALNAGEVTALLGPNGAGKSTLARIMTGVERPTAGRMTFDGEAIELASPGAAVQKGIAAVYQELPLLPNLTAAENMSLGHTGQGALSIWRPRPARATYVRLAAQIHDAPPANAVVGRLTVAQRQKVAFIRALSMDPRLLIVDEGTSSLSIEERREMQDLLRHLARTRDMAVVTISHFIEDALSGADRIVVLRDGLLALDAPAASTSHAAVLAALTGGVAQAATPTSQAGGGERRAGAGTAHLDVENLACPGIQPLSFSVGIGECVGLYGPPGCGATEALRAIAGLSAHSGTVRWNGEALPPSSAARVLRKVVYCDGDRGRNLILSWTVGRNINLPYLFRNRWLSIPNAGTERRRAREIIARFAIKGAAEEATRNLSGGNQQRAVVARTISLGPPLLLLGDDLTRGVDVVGRSHIHGLIRESVAGGAAVLLYSTDPAELAELCDRVLVLRDGAIIREIGHGDISVAVLEGETQRKRHG